MRRSNRRLFLTIFGACAGALPAVPAVGNSFTWTGKAGNVNWSSSGNWSPTGVPGAADMAFIPAAKNVTITKLTMNSLTNAGVLTFAGSNNLQGIITNTGVIAGNTLSSSQSAANYLIVPVGQTATLVGGGQVLMQSIYSYLPTTLNGNSLGKAGGAFINQDNLIHGYGSIANGIVNNGVVSADSVTGAITVSGSNYTGTGTYRAESGGVMVVGAAMTGATFDGRATGTIRASAATLFNVTNSGTLTFQQSNSVYGLIKNTGVIQGDALDLGYNSLDVPNGQTATLYGGGQVLLQVKPSGDPSYAGIDVYSAGTLVNQDNLIHGSGAIYGTIVNSGTVSADVAGKTLTVGAGVSGAGVFEARNGALLLLNGTSASSGNLTVHADGAGSVAQLSGLYTGSTLHVSETNGGIVRASSAAFVDLVNPGVLRFANGNSLGGTIVNIGVLQGDVSLPYYTSVVSHN